MRDAPREELPRFLSPMLASPGSVPAEAGWALEVKWDGIRAQLRFDDRRVCVRSRPGRDCTAEFPENSIPGSDTPQISTTITTTFASRIVVNASLSLSKSAGVGDVVCQPQIAPSSSSTFTSFSEPMYAADPGVTSNYYTVMPVSGAVDEPAGSFQIQVVCHTGAPTWSLVDADITAVATAQ